MQIVRSFLAVTVICLSASALAGEADAASATAAAKKAVDFLTAQQNEDGTFGKSPAAKVPGVVGLAVKAIADSPGHPREKDNKVLEKAAKYLVGLQQPSGAITLPRFGNDSYNTAVAVIALSALENPAYKDNIEKAKKYILSCQLGDENGFNEKDSADKYGGFGYEPGNTKPNVSIGGFTLEALKAAGLEEGSPAWKNAVKFIKRSQDNTETNDFAGMKDGDNTGGFIYAPGVADDFGSVVSKRTGKTVPKPYGNMTYQAVKSLLLAGVKKDDPALQAAFKWIKNNYSVTENPGGKGTMGYYYYIVAFSKAFTAMGEKELDLPDGKKAHWARDMATQVMTLQKADGSFANEDKEWMENDPVLATAYALDALSLCVDGMK
jgi:squalene-hopene/tetraprenyl-beta-curcumene cyclase